MPRSWQTILFLAVLLAGSVATMFNMSKSSLPIAAGADLARRVDMFAASNVPRWPSLEGIIDGLRYRLLGDAGTQVRVGCPGWLYLAEEVAEVPHGDDNLNARLRIAELLAREFHHRGITLIVIPIPDKIKETAADSCGTAVSSQAVHRLALWGAGSSTIDFIQIDPAEHWPKPGFWRTDTHWDRTGARYVAGLVAGAAGATLATTDHQPVHLKTTPPPHPRPGDLLPLAGLDHSPTWLAPVPDEDIDEAAIVSQTGGLLEVRAGAPVILAGTSYSLNSGFIDYLELALQCQVLQRSQLGGGFSGAILDLLAQPPPLLAGTKLVIWEWPERALTLPMTEAEETYLNTDHEE